MQAASVFALCTLGVALAQGAHAAPKVDAPKFDGLRIEAQNVDAQWVARIYDRASMDAILLNEALDAAGRLLSAGGAEMSWLDCSGSDASARCGAPLAENELVLRLLPQPARDGALGVAVSPAGEGRIGRYATVFTVGVADLAKTSKTPGAPLLGATIAHELGHLLLGQDSHAGRGLMRARWSVWDLRKIDVGRLEFAPEQRRRLAAASARMSRRSGAASEGLVARAD